jgi:hypothetical protein
MNTLSSSVSIEIKFESNVDGIEPISPTSNKTSCQYAPLKLHQQSSSISLIFMTSTFQTQLTNKYYVLNNTLF